MTKEQLREKINKVEVEIEKTTKSKNKYYDNLSYNVQTLANAEVGKNWMERRKLNLNWEDDINLENYYRQEDLLNYYKDILNSYKNKLKALEDLVDLPVLREFLNNWKEDTVEYLINVTDAYKERKDQIYNKYRENGCIVRGCIVNKELEKEMDKELKELNNLFGKEVVRLNTYRGEKNNQIKKEIEREAQYKYKVLVKRISGIVGEIRDCSNLKIASNGEINGIIKGDKNKAKIETIIAGGYNEHIIVNVKHGQCAHYRVLVREIK